MRRVLLTGGIGSGKTVVAGILHELGAFVYDSDAAAKRLYKENGSVREKLVQAFGPDVLTADGVDTKALSAKVFSDREALATLEAIVHPAVLEDFMEKAAGREIAVMESAIAATKPLFKDFFHLVILVDAPVATRVERASKRDGADASSVQKRIQAQSAGMLAAPDYIIVNDKDLATLKRRVKSVWNKIIVSIGL